MNDTTRHCALSWTLVASALLFSFSLSNCSPSSIENIGDADLLLDPPGPTMNHAVHAARNIECGDCHDPEERGEPKIPDPELCFDCHDEDIASAPEKLRRYFEAVRQPDGTYRFPRITYSADIVLNHRAHAAAEVACAECHGEPSERAFRRPSVLALKRSCLDCHELQGAGLDCAVCHEKIRKDEEPASHTEAFLTSHGTVSPVGWREGKGGLCAMCHEVPRSCDACHRATAPVGHRAAGFRLVHGRDALDRPFEESSCSLCHEKRSCTLCHQREKPRSHTASFERRLHGISASMERQSCMTCHKPDYCDRCHRSTVPVSHTGSFVSGRQTHCVACHDPLPSTGCYTCHKSTLGHRRATPLPAGPPHAGATDCVTCHKILPHLDDGGSCRRCHR
jgi:hypothetical protein